MPNKNKQRTYARNRTFSRRGNEKIYESDGTYLMKLVLVLLLGTFWLKFAQPLHIGGFMATGLPLGLILGLFFIHKFENFQANRKIWYAVLIIATVVSYFLPAGVVL